MAGINRATKHIYDKIALESYASTQKKPCIFLSHISVDKDAVREIGEYLKRYGDLDIYLDENDKGLQAAVKEKDPKKITNFIEKGLSYSTHIMCLISENTYSSWWVPYEIGFAKKSEKEISSLILKNNPRLPEYLEIGEILKGTKSLNMYIKNITKEVLHEYRSFRIHANLINHDINDHPLDSYLEWDK
jgi:hypothetical protein